MKSRTSSIITFFVLLMLLLHGEPVSAQSILLFDCQGFTRAAQKVDPGSLNKVEVTVSESAGASTEGAQVSLTNTVTGEVSTSVINNGVAVFENVAPGAFTVSTTSESLVVASVGVGSMGAGAAAAGAAALAGAGVVGGAGAVAIPLSVEEIDNQVNNDDNNESTPTPTPETSPTPQIPVATPTPVPQATATPFPTPIDCDCDPNAEPDPIDDFFQNQAENQKLAEDSKNTPLLAPQRNQISPYS